MEENGHLHYYLSEDLIKGNGLLPQTLNPYVYCWNSPLMFVDLDGKSALVATLVIIGGSMFLSGCTSKKVETFDKVVEPITPIGPEKTTKSIVQVNQGLFVSDHNINLKNQYIKVSDYKIEERLELIEFMKYTESGGKYNGGLHDADGDGIKETMAYGHDVIENGDKDLYINRTLTEQEGEELLIADLKKRVPETWLKYMESKGISLLLMK